MNKINRIAKTSDKIVKSQINVPKPIYNVRIRPEVYEPLIMDAASESRSITAHINHILTKYLKRD